MDKSPSEYERKGRSFWLKGEYFRALKAMQEGLSHYPNDTRLKLGLAMAQLKLGNFAVARDILEDLLRINPANGDALAALLEASLSLGRRKEALECAKKLERYHGKSVPLLEHVGMIFLDRGLFAESVYYFKKSLGQAPRRPYARLGLGIAYSGLHKINDAIREVRAAIRLKKNFYEAMSYLGNLLYDSGQKNAAHALFLKIPVAELSDPVTVSRLLDYCRASGMELWRCDALSEHLRQLTTGHDINYFMKTLEAGTQEDETPRKAASDKGSKHAFVRVSPQAPLTHEQKDRLARIDGFLTLLFGRPGKAIGFEHLPKVRNSNANCIESFFGDFAEHMKSSAELAISQPDIPVSGWTEAYGVDSVAPYTAALLRHLYNEGDNSGLAQHAVDSLMAGTISLLKWMPPGLKGSRWLTELGGTIVAFWTAEDMLERFLLMREILSPAERRSVDPILARGRALRRWLGFKADTRWAYPSTGLFRNVPKTYGAGKPVKCASCGRVIKDFWEIASAGGIPVRCGDCAPARRCQFCGGPARQIAVAAKGGKKKAAFICMECGAILPPASRRAQE